MLRRLDRRFITNYVYNMWLKIIYIWSYPKDILYAEVLIVGRDVKGQCGKVNLVGLNREF